ncbi:MAG: cyclic nucleotide-binding domain-containing protein [Desulfobacteraceae bacterium]|nr:cyclic nucleotide-binding domain-containing protein [Desulfobacteraceae bacterium]
MHFKQAEILKGLDNRFIAKMMEMGVKSTYGPATVLFSQGDPARHFFILLKGRVRLSIDDNKNSIYTVNHSGEAFGWSSLAGSDNYTASAECVDKSTLIAFDRYKMDLIMSDDPRSAALFYKNLALTLGNRLVRMNSQLADHLSFEDKISYGTGQVQEEIHVA